ncbi:uncharacterized protein LOC143199657 isoform X2 [Rhynchophorus ferrugineus]|uniref:uncharacterized protein LOC143199657 isoform X2 n=1 Tax=Rhynchophorus ferrugineus TaxID=354439 RepID=UPI003FCD424E
MYTRRQALLILKYIRSVILKWAGENPAQALAATIIIAGCLLPFISAMALMPLVAVINAGNYIQTTVNLVGVSTIITTVFGPGSFLALILVILFTAAFLMGVVATCIHYYIIPNNIIAIK